VNTFTSEFPNLKNKALSNKLGMILELLKWKRHLCLGNTRWKSQVIKILYPMASNCNGHFVVMCFSLILTFCLFLF
jgi:hypothetical protein